MTKRMKKDPAAWRNTPAGVEAYRVARASAQAAANADGFDRGLEANDLFKSWRTFMLPGKGYRYGFEARCEVVSCEDLTRCVHGHGPMASLDPFVGARP